MLVRVLPSGRRLWLRYVTVIGQAFVLRAASSRGRCSMCCPIVGSPMSLALRGCSVHRSGCLLIVNTILLLIPRPPTVKHCCH